MKKILVILVLLATMTMFAYADDDRTKMTSGIFSEMNTSRYDYSMNYNVLKAGQWRLEFDQWIDNPNNLTRLWANYDSFNLARSQNFNASFSPEILLDTKQRIYYGGFLDLDFPKTGLHIHQKAFGGNLTDKFITFTDLSLGKNVGLRHYYYMEQNYAPDSYLGPTLNLCDTSLWAGTSTNRPGAWAVDISLTIKF